jgi:DNA repair protein RadD
MIPSLRDYQSDMIGRTRVAMRSHRKVLVVSPTGSGKTVLAAFMSGSAVKKNLRVGFVCHRKELIKQAARTFGEVGIPFGIVSAGMTGNRHQPVQICGVNTLANRLDIVGHLDLVIWDESHHIAAASWARIMEHYGDARHVGLSATPERLDGTGLGKYFDAMVPGPRVAWLIENGYLAPYRLLAPSVPELDGVKTVAGEYDRRGLGEAMAKPKLIGDMVAHYARLAPGKRNMVFCVSVKHSLAVVEKYQAAGFRAAHIDGATDPAVRDQLIADFTAGRIQVLSSVDLVSEGFDLPAIEVATLARPTKSVSLYLQQVGRSLRTAPGKTEAIILDHAGNSLNHGLPDDDREWSLEGRQRRKRKKGDEDEPAVAVRQCPSCFSVHRPAPHCPRCNHEYLTLGRTVEELEGELTEVVRAQAKHDAKVEVARAKTKEELVRLGTLRGYKSPHFWAMQVMANRAQRERRA